MKIIIKCSVTLQISILKYIISLRKSSNMTIKGSIVLCMFNKWQEQLCPKNKKTIFFKVYINPTQSHYFLYEILPEVKGGGLFFLFKISLG